MCGIAGFVGWGEENLLQAMCTSLGHRGPDDMGSYLAPGIGLTTCRLAMIDLKTGNQPISDDAVRGGC